MKLKLAIAGLMIIVAPAMALADSDAKNALRKPVMQPAPKNRRNRGEKTRSPLRIHSHASGLFSGIVASK